MKTLITLLFTLGLLFAGDYKYCKEMAGLAKSTMQLRQQGVPMVKLYELNEKLEDGPFKEMMDLMVNQAYAEPRYSSDKYQQRAVTEFENEWFRACMEATDERR